MNIKENIRKVLREEVNKQILTKIVRRLDNIDKLIFQSAEWTSQYYKEKFLKEKGLDWFIETVIDGFYIDYISPIFENWDDDGQLEPVMSISDDEEEELRTFFEDKYYDKIEEYYENIFGNNIDESIIRDETELPEFISEIFDDGEEPKLVKKHSTKETITYDYSLPSKKSEGTYIIRMTLYKKYLSLDLKNVMELEFYYSKDGVADLGYTGLNEILYLFTSINKLIEKHKKEFKYLMVASTKDRLSLYKKTISRISYLTLVDTSDRYILYSNSQYSRWF